MSTWDSDLRIVDVASGTIQTLVADLPYGISPIRWSQAGDKILFSTYDNQGVVLSGPSTLTAVAERRSRLLRAAR